MKLSTLRAYNELCGERGQKRSMADGGMARKRASKIGRVKATTKSETGGVQHELRCGNMGEAQPEKERIGRGESYAKQGNSEGRDGRCVAE